MSFTVRSIESRDKVVPLIQAVELNPRPDRSSLTDDLDISFVPMAAVEATTGRVDTSTVRLYGEVKKGYTTFREGDILFAKITPCMENGKMAVARGLRNGVGCGSTEFHVLRPREGVDPNYVYHFVSSARFRKEAAHHMTGAVGQKRVPAMFLEACEIPLPNLEEQRRCVGEIEKQFSRLDEAVANLKRVKANLRRYRASVLNAAISGRLVSTEAELAQRNRKKYESGMALMERVLADRKKEWSGKKAYNHPMAPDPQSIPELPQGWTVASLEAITSATRVICYGILMPKENVKDGVLYVKVRDMKADVIDLPSLQRTSYEIAAKYARASLRAGDLLLSIRGTYGRVATVPPELEGGNITQDTARIDVSPILSREFVAIYLRSEFAQQYFKRVARGVAVKGVNIGDIRPMPVPIPPLAEQRRIVDETERRMSLVREVQAEVDANLKRAEGLRQATLSKLFS